MKVVVDRSRCTGLGLCEATAPAVFEIDDRGDLVILAANVPPDDSTAVRAAVRAAVEGCPTHALTLVDDAAT